SRHPAARGPGHPHRDLAAQQALRQQAHAVRQAARSRWAAAHDARWLDQADLLDVGRVWSAAVPHAAHDPTAETAARNCEERLRRLHPHQAVFDRFPHGPSRDDWERHRWERAAEQRARELLDEMEACPGGTAPRDEESRSALESRANLPIQAIDAAM